MTRLRRGSRIPFKARSMHRGKSRFRKSGFRAFRRGFDRTSGLLGFATQSREVKYIDGDITDALVATAGFIDATMCDIAQGVAAQQRVGRKCTITQIGVKFAIKLPSTTTATSTSDIVRVMFVVDKQTNAAAPTVANILQAADLLSFNNLTNSQRFRTLMDRNYAINSSGGDSTDSNETQIHDTFFKKLNLPIEYAGTTGDIGEIRSNNIICLLISTDGLCAFDAKFRLRFTDS